MWIRCADMYHRIRLFQKLEAPPLFFWIVVLASDTLHLLDHEEN